MHEVLIRLAVFGLVGIDFDSLMVFLQGLLKVAFRLGHCTQAEVAVVALRVQAQCFIALRQGLVE